MSKFTAMTVADQTKAIASIRRRGKTLKQDAHALCVGFLLHYEAHGDMSKAMVIADAIGEAFTKGIRTAFIEWCVLHTNTMRYDPKKRELVHEKGQKVVVDRKCEVTTIFDVTRGEPKPFDYMDALVSLVKRAEKAKEKDQIDEKALHALETFAKSQGITIGNDGKIAAPVTEEKPVVTLVTAGQRRS